MHILRKLIAKTGIDIHRYRREVDRWSWIRTSNIKTVIDIGANVGQFRDEVRRELPTAFIYSFEPLRECFEKLKEKEASDKFFRAFNLALGDTNEKSKINKSSYTLSSSLLPMSDTHKTAFPHTKHSTEETIEIKRTDDFFADKNLEDEILIKVDTQGYEDKVISGGVNTFSKAKVVIIETSYIALYVGQPLFKDVYRTLSSMGFTYRGALHQKLNRDTGEVLFEDSLFVRVSL